MMSNKIMLGFLLILLSIGCTSAANLNVGVGQTYTTIQSAIDDAKTGDVILVSDGTYFENLVVKTNGILIKGIDKEKTIIDGKRTGSIIRIDQANNVEVSGFTLQNSGGSGKEDAGVNIYTANNNKIVNIIFLNNIVGISIYQGSHNNIVSGNDIKYSSKYGIFIFSSDDNNIINNNIQENKIGIYSDSGRYNYIYSNNFIDNNNQAFDNSGLNSWDNGKLGNYWYKKDGGDASYILGGKAEDRYPDSKAFTIKYEEETTPADVKNTQAETEKSTPGFTGIGVFVLMISYTILISRKNT